MTISDMILCLTFIMMLWLFFKYLFLERNVNRLYTDNQKIADNVDNALAFLKNLNEALKNKDKDGLV